MTEVVLSHPPMTAAMLQAVPKAQVSPAEIRRVAKELGRLQPPGRRMRVVSLMSQLALEGL